MISLQTFQNQRKKFVKNLKSKVWGRSWNITIVKTLEVTHYTLRKIWITKWKKKVRQNYFNCKNLHKSKKQLNRFNKGIWNLLKKFRLKKLTSQLLQSKSQRIKNSRLKNDLINNSFLFIMNFIWMNRIFNMKKEICKINKTMVFWDLLFWKKEKYKM